MKDRRGALTTAEAREAIRRAIEEDQAFYANLKKHGGITEDRIGDLIGHALGREDIETAYILATVRRCVALENVMLMFGACRGINRVLDTNPGPVDQGVTWWAGMPRKEG